MAHVRALNSVQLRRPSIVAIGVFDGVHRGHRTLVDRLVNEAAATGRSPVVITFFPHPDVLLRGLTGRYYLSTPEERADMLLALGVDTVITLPFDDQLRHMRAADFVDQLVHYVKLSSLWVGSDFALGYKREGNVPFLREQGERKGFSVHTIDLIMTENGAISSTAIREALQLGQVEQAGLMLARPYSVTGEVVHGLARGRTIGFPTANIDAWSEQVLPANGIYAGWTEVDGQRWMAATNIGMRPTFDGQAVTVESHLIDFDGDLYGRPLTVSFNHRLRDERRFESIDALIAQIQADVLAARQVLQET